MSAVLPAPALGGAEPQLSALLDELTKNFAKHLPAKGLKLDAEGLRAAVAYFALMTEYARRQEAELATWRAREEAARARLAGALQ